MIKKFLVFWLTGLFSFSAAAMTFADSGWGIAIHELDQTGFFDYTLYYPYSSQVISRVTLPQNQPVKIINVKYDFTIQKDFILFQYGGSGTGFKGKGSDSDWTIDGSDILTDYGVLDAWGEQRIVAVDFGTVLFQNEIYKVNILTGWVQQETTNELRNIVYHLVNGVELGALPQPDNGSYLDGEFKGLVFGITQALMIRPNLFLTTEFNVSFLRINAYGHWANHTPAWNWENTGRTVGYGADITLKYVFNSNIQAEIGYDYNYSKATGCRENLNGELISQIVDLEFERKGLHASMVFLF